MATVRLRPGPWKIVNSDSSNAKEIQIDYEFFDVPPSGTVEFEIGKMGLFDNTNLTAYRNPVSTVVSTGNLGQSLKSNNTYNNSPLGRLLKK